MSAAQWKGLCIGLASDADDHRHHLFVLTLMDKLFLAPLPSLENIHVLDVGTGTGKWAMFVPFHGLNLIHHLTAT